jgi:hypothetical protein
MYNEEEYKTTYYKSSTGENITENSVPNMDDWGWDNYWNCQDWIEWHKIMKSKKGKTFADTNFMKWWEAQTSFSNTYNCRSYDKTFRDYFRGEKLLDNLYSGIGVIAAPIGAGSDVVVGVSEGVSDLTEGVFNTAKALKYVLPVLLIVGIGFAGFIVYKKAIK